MTLCKTRKARTKSTIIPIKVDGRFLQSVSVDIEVAFLEQLPYLIHTTSKSKDIAVDDRQVSQKWYPLSHRNSLRAISKLARGFHPLDPQQELRSLHTRAAVAEKEIRDIHRKSRNLFPQLLGTLSLHPISFARSKKIRKENHESMLKREYQVKFRLDKSEYELLKKKLKQSGQTQQSFLINSISEVAITSKEEVIELKELSQKFDDLIRQIRGMATNINQMAHVANGMGLLPTERELIEIANQIPLFRRECEEKWQSIRRLISRQRHTEQ